MKAIYLFKAFRKVKKKGLLRGGGGGVSFVTKRTATKGYLPQDRK